MEAIVPAAAPKARVELARLVKEGNTDAEILALLVGQSEDSHAVQQLTQEVKKLRSARSTAQGLLLIMIGALVLFVSFITAYMHFYSGGSLSFVLYGLTSAGIVIAFVGLMKILG